MLFCMATAAPAKSRPGPAAGRDEFVAAWTEFFSSVRRARGRYAREGGGLSLSQHQCLLALGDEDGLRIGEIAARAGIAAPTATRMLDSLERNGVVERRHSSEDRRAITIHLTDDGRRQLKRKRRDVEGKLSAIYDSLPQAERAQSAELLHNLAIALEEL